MNESLQDSSGGLSGTRDSAVASSLKSTEQSATESCKKADDVLSLMRRRLPEYAVNCFLASGFDVLEVISAMDISDNPGNSIAKIEGFIAKRYKGDPRFCPFNPSMDFEFPPGHRMRICNFVREIREMCSAVKTKSHACGKKGKRSVGKCSGRVHVKKTKLTSTDESESEVNVSTVSNQIRISVSAWIRKQTDERLKSLQENRHYSVLITHIPKDSHALTISIRCIGCDTCVRLQKKDNSSNATPYLISNWCRHVKRCNTFRGKRVQQPTIDNFMSHCWSENASCSLSKTEYPSQISDSVTQEEFDEISKHVDRFVMSPNAFSLAP